MPELDNNLEQFIESWIPINVKDTQIVKEAKIAARKEFVALIKEREAKLVAEEVNATLDRLKAKQYLYQSDYGARYGIPLHELESQRKEVDRGKISI